MRTALATVVVVMLAGVAWAKDVPPAPATRPAAATAEDVAQLREQVKALAAAVDVLRAEVAAMKGGGGRAAAPAATAPAAPSDKEVQAAIAKRRLLIGMTPDDVRKVFDENGELQYKSGSTEDWAWEASRGVDFTGEGKTEEIGTWLIRCHFRNGRLVSFAKSY